MSYDIIYILISPLGFNKTPNDLHTCIHDAITLKNEFTTAHETTIQFFFLNKIANFSRYELRLEYKMLT